MPGTLERPRAATATIKLNSADRDRLKSLAVIKKRTTHYLMKEAIERYLVTEEAQQAILRSIDHSVAHFEAAGLHITLDEFKTWAKEVQVVRNAQLPACHT